MTDIMAGRQGRAMIARVRARIASPQRQLSDRVHKNGDALAREHRWTITTTTGRLGFGGRVYRDPRFAERAPGVGRGAPREQDTGRLR